MGNQQLKESKKGETVPLARLLSVALWPGTTGRRASRVAVRFRSLARRRGQSRRPMPSPLRSARIFDSRAGESHLMAGRRVLQEPLVSRRTPVARPTGRLRTHYLRPRLHTRATDLGDRPAGARAKGVIVATPPFRALPAPWVARNRVARSRARAIHRPLSTMR